VGVLAAELEHLQQPDQAGPVVVCVGGPVGGLHRPPVGGAGRLVLGDQVPQAVLPDDGKHHPPHRVVGPRERRVGDPEQDALLALDPPERVDQLSGDPPLGPRADPVDSRDQQVHQRVGDLPSAADGEPPGDPRVAVEALVVRYLAAFEPAAVRDIQAWAGVTRLGEVVGSLRPRLRAYHGADGRELWDLADADLADEDAPVPVRFLPEYDNAILGYADHSRILPDGVTGLVVPADDDPSRDPGKGQGLCFGRDRVTLSAR
jgi:hypothetical protein